MKRVALVAIFSTLTAVSTAQTPATPPQISAEDKAKIEMLYNLMLGAQREPVRWHYRVIDQNVTRWSAETLQSFLNSKAGRYGYELVASTLLADHRTRFIFKAKEKGTPDH